ncbi:MAG: hypothetical protein J6U70_06940 [Bacteroidales bacterium]|nr:hypothetical protein [Bacteroidales bacterium]
MSIRKLFRQLLPILLVGQLIYACEKLPAIGTDSTEQKEDSLSIASIVDVMNAGTWMGIYPMHSGEDSCYWQIETIMTVFEVDSGYQCRMIMRLSIIGSTSRNIISREIEEPWVVERTLFEDVEIRGGEEGFLITSLEEEGASIRLWFDRFDLCCYSESTLVPLYKKYFQEELYPVTLLSDDLLERETIYVPSNVKSLDDCLNYGFRVNNHIHPFDLYVIISLYPHPEYPTARLIVGGTTSIGGIINRVEKDFAEDVTMDEYEFLLHGLEIDSELNEIRGYLNYGDKQPYLRICYLSSTERVVLYWTPGEYFDEETESRFPYCPDELCIQLYQESYLWHVPTTQEKEGSL